MYLLKIGEALKNGDTGDIRYLIFEALDKGFSSDQILNEALIPAMDEVGRMYKGSKLFIPEVLKASRAMHSAIHLIQKKYPHDSNLNSKAVRVVIGTVAGDLHDIGKNLVAILMRARGHHVIDLGIDVPKEEFLWAIHKHKPQVLAMSAFLTTTMPGMLEIINDLKTQGLRNNLKIIIGGGPVTDQFAREIGADGYARDAYAATDWLNENFPA